MSDGYWKGRLASPGAAPTADADFGPAPARGVAPARGAEPARGAAPASGVAPAYGAAPASGVASASSEPATAPGSEEAGAAAHSAPHSGSVSPQARRIYAAEAMRQKDHVSAGLLAIFLGMFGMHKFYLGCNQVGFLMLAVSIIGGMLTLGLAAAVIWVIAIIEGIIYLTKSQTEFDKIYVLAQRDWF